MAVQIAAYPHWSGTKTDKRAGDRARERFIRQLQAQAYGPDRAYDRYGRRVLHSPQEFRSWLAEWGIQG